jgi:biopolymer transport protein ExbD
MAIAVGPQPDEVSAAINTTPLVDVMLVLLIIFLITVPVVTGAPVVLPKAAASPTVEDRAVLQIVVFADGRMTLNGEPIDNNGALTERLQTLAAQTPQPPIHLRADEKTRFGTVRRIAASLRGAGFAKLGFITEPERGEPR